MLQEAKALVEEIQQCCEQESQSLEQQALCGKRLGEALNHNHALLHEVGVSSEHLERLVRCARQQGAWGAKLTGAGMGGGMFALAPLEDLPALAQALQQEGARSTHLYDPNKPLAAQETHS
ncbi:MAG: hypothetical protein H6728_15625 [Myxococcales bacterium]|nr:hypothetical protein [Myxococcales bacterium]